MPSDVVTLKFFGLEFNLIPKRSKVFSTEQFKSHMTVISGQTMPIKPNTFSSIILLNFNDLFNGILSPPTYRPFPCPEQQQNLAWPNFIGYRSQF